MVTDTQNGMRTSLDGAQALEQARRILPQQILRAMDNRVPLADILVLCQGKSDWAEIVRKCNPIWHFPKSALADQRLTLPVQIVKQSSFSIELSPAKPKSRQKGKIALLGPAGTFTEAAVKAHFAEFANPSRYQLCPTNAGVVKAMAMAPESCWAVAPFQNITGGVVTEVFTGIWKALHRGSSIAVTDSVWLPVRHCLVGVPDSVIGEVTEVRSHPNALTQCEESIERLLGAIAQVSCVSTAAALAEIMEAGDKAKAAICSRKAAEAAGAQILAEGFQDIQDNGTQFLVMNNQGWDHAPTGNDITFVMFTTDPERAGSLDEVIYPLKEAGLSKVVNHSFPNGRRDEFWFAVMFLGHRQDPVVHKALKMMWAQSNQFYCLGSFPKRW